MADWYFASAVCRDVAAQGGCLGITPKLAWTLQPSVQRAGCVIEELLRPGDTLWVLDYHDWDDVNTHLGLCAVQGLEIRGDHPGRPGFLPELTLGTACRGVQIKKLIVGCITVS